MKGDNTRDTFAAEKHFRSVRQQQGRVQLDADWNELTDIVEYLVRTITADLLGGPAAVPTDATAALTTSGNPAFRVGGFGINATNSGTTPSPTGNNLLIEPGRFYVDGLLCESGRDRRVPFTEQPDFPGAELPQAAGLYAVYLDAWQRHVSAVEDPSLRDVALGGPDTATRTRALAQVKIVPEAEFATATAAPTGQLAARVRAEAVQGSSPCDPTGGAGFSGLENQLYRVEIHRGNLLAGGAATFKWSRENGSVVAAVVDIVSDGTVLQPTSPPQPLLNVLVLESPPPDRERFKRTDWVELLDDRLELAGTPGQFLQIIDVDGARLTFDTSNIRDESGNVTSPVLRGIDPAAHPKIRRWDSAGPTAIARIEASGFQALESGIEVQFSSNSETYRSGDYWLIPARAGFGIEWPTQLAGSPPQPQPSPRAPHGIAHHFARLATVNRNGGGKFSVTLDARRRASPLTGMLAEDVLYNVVSTCQVQLGLSAHSTVAAALEAICNRLGALSTPNAQQVPYDNTGACTGLSGLGSPTSVAAALDTLCARVTGINATTLGVLPLSGGTLTGSLAVNSTLSTTGDITSGGRVRDQKVRASQAASNKVTRNSDPASPNVVVFADLPGVSLSVVVPGTGQVALLVGARLSNVTVDAAATLLQARAEFRIFVGNNPVATVQRTYVTNSAGGSFETHTVCVEAHVLVAAGTHTIKAQWGVATPQQSATLNATLSASNERTLYAIEL